LLSISEYSTPDHLFVTIAQTIVVIVDARHINIPENNSALSENFIHIDGKAYLKDDDYQKLYKEIEILKNKDIDRWQCGILDLSSFEDFSFFDGKAIRTYHPVYLNRNLKKFGDDILSYIKNEIKASNCY
jgi:hypothetical protein